MAGTAKSRFQEALDDLIDDHLTSKNETWGAACNAICSTLELKLMALRHALHLQAEGSSGRREGGFRWTLEHLQLGHRLRRRSWIAKGIDMYIILERGLCQPDSTPLDCEPYIAAFTHSGRGGYWDQWGRWQPGEWGHSQHGWWVCTQADLLASDWELLLDYG
jgi:hypothetical protein